MTKRALTRMLSVVCVYFIGGIATSIGQAPANDLFANRTFLSGTNITVQGNNINATTEPGEYIGSGIGLLFNSLWYAWTSPTNGILHLSVEPWTFYPSIRVYRGGVLNALNYAPPLSDNGVPVWPNETVVIQLASGLGGAGYFTLDLEFEYPPPLPGNDDFTNRLDITIPAYHIDAGIRGATREPGEELPLGTSQSLWWKFTGPDTGIFAAWVRAPQFTPVLSLFEGDNMDSLVRVSPIKELRFRVQRGHEYVLQMASPDVPGGAFTLDTQFFGTTNDLFAFSTQLEGTNVTYFGNLMTATLEPGEANPGYSNSIWFSWAAPATGRVSLRWVDDAIQPIVVYTGPTLERLQRVPMRGIEWGRVDFYATAEKVYHFQVSGLLDECRVSLRLFPYYVPTNDFLMTARRSVSPSINIDWEWVPISEATAELGEPRHLGSSPFKSVWWAWTVPHHGSAAFLSERSLATNVVLAAYKGKSVEALTLVGKGTNLLQIPVTGGETYYLAAAVPAETVGDVLVYNGLSHSTMSIPVPGNILGAPSWEGSNVGQYWKTFGPVGATINGLDGCDGTTWPHLFTDARIWQDVRTGVGWRHSIRFAMRADPSHVGLGGGDGRVQVLWNGQEIGVGVLPQSELLFWHWAEFVGTANTLTTRVAFVSIGRGIEVDAFSVVPLTDPPRIITQPTSVTTIQGGTASFIVGVSGSTPLTYRWYFNDSPLTVLTNPALIIDPVSPPQSGVYQAVVTNAFGSITSAAVSLRVEAPLAPVILWQPYGDTIGIGGSFQFSVVAAGTAPLTYQWFKDGNLIDGETNRTLGFPNVQPENGGNYVARVRNNAGVVWSVSALLSATNTFAGGGQVNLLNRFFLITNVFAPVFDVDGLTRLNGSNYLAQLYAGSSFEFLRPAGRPSRFQTGFNAGYFDSQVVTLATVPPGSNVIVQVRAWDGTKGSSYEEARALGGRFGKSELLSLQAGGGQAPPAQLIGLQSFELTTSQHEFVTGRINWVGRSPGGIVIWSHEGEPGSRYLIERAVHGFEWFPFIVITNQTSTATFTDVARSGSAQVFYRSRILD